MTWCSLNPRTKICIGEFVELHVQEMGFLVDFVIAQVTRVSPSGPARLDLLPGDWFRTNRLQLGAIGQARITPILSRVDSKDRQRLDFNLAIFREQKMLAYCPEALREHLVMNNSSIRVVGRIVGKRLEQNQPNHVGMTPPRRTPTHEVQLTPISSQPVQAVQLRANVPVLDLDLLT